MFTDESRFALETDDKRIRMWRKQRTRNQPQNITEHHAFRGLSIMVWAGISLGYRTNLHIFDDNARPHRTDIVDDYLESEGIARMAWPAYSPNINPIENVWDILGLAISSRFPPPATLIELEIALQ
ncbi:transposable element Tcb1 transposase [Trichonephila clavipes]|nr:transposable element Tcb1 transposase [Trichonephila clavipes]